MEGVHIFKSPFLNIVVQKVLDALINHGQLRYSIITVHLPICIDICNRVEQNQHLGVFLLIAIWSSGLLNHSAEHDLSFGEFLGEERQLQERTDPNASKIDVLIKILILMFQT